MTIRLAESGVSKTASSVNEPYGSRESSLANSIESQAMDQEQQQRHDSDEPVEENTQTGYLEDQYAKKAYYEDDEEEAHAFIITERQHEEGMLNSLKQDPLGLESVSDDQPVKNTGFKKRKPGDAAKSRSIRKKLED
jgi:hypothetical protein